MNLRYEELEVAEEFGGWRDFFEGVACGIAISSGVVAIIALT